MANPRVFLSYTHDEEPFVRSVATELHKRGVDSAPEESELKAGDPFSESIQASLRSSSLMVVFIGRSADSPWVNFEIGAAIGQAKTVLPVFLSHQARRAAPPVVRDVAGIDASELKPEDVADRIATSITAAG